MQGPAIVGIFDRISSLCRRSLGCSTSTRSLDLETMCWMRLSSYSFLALVVGDKPCSLLLSTLHYSFQLPSYFCSSGQVSKGFMYRMNVSECIIGSFL